MWLTTAAYYADLDPAHFQVPKDDGLAELFDHAITDSAADVLQLVAEGRSAKEIAAVLHISPRTAEFHKARLMEALGAQSTAELIQYAIRTGMSAV